MPLLTPRPAPVSSDRLCDALELGSARARARDNRVLVSLAEPMPWIDPLAVYATAPRETERVFWQHRLDATPDEPRQALAGIGAAHTIMASGNDRFSHVRNAWRTLLDGAVLDAPPVAGPRLLGGFSFDPLQPRTVTWAGFPDARFTLPRFCVSVSDRGAWLTTNVLIDAEADVETLAQATIGARAELIERARLYTAPSPLACNDSVPEDILPAEAWQAIVGRTAREIREERFSKVVLARQARVAALRGVYQASGRPFDAAATLAELRHSYPNSFIFAFSHPDSTGDRTFLGATPERLVRLHDRMVEASSLAGSIRRGASPEEDTQLGQALLCDTKELTEHSVVADMLREALSPVCRELSIPFPPTLLKLANVQHLFTPIHGVLSNGQTVLDLVERLHPTPAVGGFPRQEALAAIREREQLDRGWYAGPIGWLDQRGEGEFAVAIRSALLDESRGEALLFAGCGIVGNSNPQSEYAESRLKMQAMLSALR